MDERRPHVDLTVENLPEGRRVDLSGLGLKGRFIFEGVDERGWVFRSADAPEDGPYERQDVQWTNP